MAAAMELAPEDEPGAEARPDREEDEVLHPARDPVPPLADGREVDVVLDRDGETQPVANVVTPGRPSRPGTFVASRSWPVSASTTPGTPTTAPSISCAESPHDSASESRSTPIGLDRSVGVGSVELDVLARPHVAAQVADRAAQEAGADVEAEDERGLRDRSKKTAP